jgi:phosphoglycolate phosphatase-like HAD superfamily hydrolase
MRVRAGSVVCDVEAIIFDKDGTLIDLGASWSPAGVRFVEICADGDHGLARALDSAIGMKDGTVVPDGVLAAGTMGDLLSTARRVLAEFGLDDVAGLVEEAHEAASGVASSVLHPIGDVTHTMGRLAGAGLRLAVTTSDDRAPTLRTLADLEVAGLVEVVVAGDDGITPKPAPDPLLLAADRLGVAIGNTLYVGDSLVDVAAARSAGVAAVVMVGRPDGPAAQRADGVIASIEEIEPLG